MAFLLNYPCNVQKVAATVFTVTLVLVATMCPCLPNQLLYGLPQHREHLHSLHANIMVATSTEPTTIRAMRVLTIAVALAWVLFISISQQVSNDFWLQAKIGELILQTHEIPATVLFPFTEIRNATFNSHEWLPSIGFYEILTALGEDSLPLVGGLMGCLLFVQTARLIYWRTHGHIGLAISFALLALAVENYRHVLRPELLSLILFLACLDCLASLQRQFSAFRVGLFAVVSVVWANVHGSFFLAPLMALVFGIGCWLDRLLKTVGSSTTASPEAYFWLALGALACTLANPLGFGLWEFVLNFSQASVAKQEIIEWIPTFDPRIRPIRGVWVGVTSIAICLALIWKKRRTISHVDVLLGLLYMSLACSASRFLVYMGFIAAYLASAPTALRPKAAMRQLAPALALGVFFWCLVWRYGNANGMYPSSNPDQTKLTTAMVHALADPSMQGHVLVSYGLGAELVYRAYPRLQPSIDSRLDSYGDNYFYLHESLWGDPVRMSEFVQRYGVRYVLTDWSDFEVAQGSGALDPKQWSIRLMDYKAVLLELAR